MKKIIVLIGILSILSGCTIYNLEKKEYSQEEFKESKRLRKYAKTKCEKIFDLNIERGSVAKKTKQEETALKNCNNYREAIDELEFIQLIEEEEKKK